MQQFVGDTRPTKLRNVVDGDKAITITNNSGSTVYVAPTAMELMNIAPGGTPTNGIPIATGNGLQWPTYGAGEIWGRTAAAGGVYVEVQP
jgi:hypothetical protein